MNKFEIDTQLVLAATVHDVKNSLGLINAEIESVISEITESQPHAAKVLREILIESSRINNGLMHMLGLYRFNKNTLALKVDEIMVLDVIEDMASRYVSSLEHLGIELDIQIDDELSWYLDPTLVEGILHNVITNSIRYTKKKITISAEVEDNWLSIVLMDDGDGYPEVMLNCLHDHGDINFKTRSTGLGIFFSEQIAKMHQDDEREGYIELANDPETHGAVFTLKLP